MGGNDAADERRFATAARLSEINLNLYRSFLQPVVRTFVTPAVADAIRTLHPLRLQYELASDENPMMAPIAKLADEVRERRRAAAADNPFLAIERNVSEQIVAALDGWRQLSETWCETMFLTAFGSPVLQAAVGVDPGAESNPCKAAKNPLHRRLLDIRVAELRSRIAAGGPREAIVRALLHVGMGRGAVDERGFEMARRIRESHSDMSITAFKALVREQFAILQIDQDAALRAIPELLPEEPATRRAAFGLISQILAARGDLTDEDRARLGEIARLFGVEEEADAVVAPSPLTRVARRKSAS
jgi:hypothetical protein